MHFLLRPLVLLLVAVPAMVLAHHGNFTYDGTTVVTLQGEVLAFNWRNPHGSVRVRLDSGEEVTIETDGPSLIQPMGVTPESLVPGMHVVAYASPSNRGRSDEFLGREFLREDSELVPVSVAYARREEREDLPKATSVIGTWVPDRTNLFAHVASSASWQLTPAGQASFDSYDTMRPFAQTNCIAATTPTLMTYPTANVVSQSGDRIDINADWMGATRTIYMDGRAHPDAGEQFYQGYSVGKWEDGDLVIDTRNFAPSPIGNVFSIASGPRKRVVERLSLDEGGASLTWRFTLEDPDYLAAPVTASYQWHYRPDVGASSEACDLEAASKYLQE
jgi:hypothetical protein